MTIKRKLTSEPESEEIMRKGQRLCNYIVGVAGFPNEQVHRKLFYMQDWEFEYVMSLTDKKLVKEIRAARRIKHG